MEIEVVDPGSTTGVDGPGVLVVIPNPFHPT
jgi:hypothetical protein